MTEKKAKRKKFSIRFLFLIFILLAVGVNFIALRNASKNRFNIVGEKFHQVVFESWKQVAIDHGINEDPVVTTNGNLAEMLRKGRLSSKMQSDSYGFDCRCQSSGWFFGRPEIVISFFPGSIDSSSNPILEKEFKRSFQAFYGKEVAVKVENEDSPREY